MQTRETLVFFIINLFVVQDWATFLMLIYE
nr:MAG TPA: hypothetical protein [Caudoviricetes sp.]